MNEKIKISALIDTLLQKIFISEQPIKCICFATTANRNNPPLHIGGLRKTDNYVCANLIFSDQPFIKDVVEQLDGKVDLFFVDCEIKNTVTNLEEIVRKNTKKTKIHSMKPNDFTVAALDEWLSQKIENITNKNILIVGGAGNIGAKISLVLAERGANVYINDIDAEKIETLIKGLTLIIRGSGKILSFSNSKLISFDAILGCTPGIPAVTLQMVEHLNDNGILIDVGNGTFCKEAILFAREKNLSLYCLTPEAGFAAFIKRYDKTQHFIARTARKVCNSGVVMITPGIVGNLGDILVDNVDHISQIIGVCNGKGDLLSPQDAEKFLVELDIK